MLPPGERRDPEPLQRLGEPAEDPAEQVVGGKKDEGASLRDGEGLQQLFLPAAAWNPLPVVSGMSAGMPTNALRS